MQIFTTLFHLPLSANHTLTLSVGPLLSDLRGGERKRGQERGREKVSLCYADQADAWRRAVCYRDNRAADTGLALCPLQREACKTHTSTDTSSCQTQPTHADEDDSGTWVTEGHWGFNEGCGLDPYVRMTHVRLWPFIKGIMTDQFTLYYCFKNGLETSGDTYFKKQKMHEVCLHQTMQGVNIISSTWSILSRFFIEQ